jgi:hypothetical protein
MAERFSAPPDVTAMRMRVLDQLSTGDYKP